MIADINLFNTFAGNYETGSEVTAMKMSILASAEEKVIEYIGYDPTRKTVTERYSGIDSDEIFLNRKNITEIESIKVDGVEISGYSFENDRVYMEDGSYSFTRGINNIVVTYTSGWEEDEMPDPLKIATVRIAALMLEETNGNIGVTSKSFGDNSRTFVKLTDYRDYLKQISSYRVLRF